MALRTTSSKSLGAMGCIGRRYDALAAVTRQTDDATLSSAGQAVAS